MHALVILPILNFPCTHSALARREARFCTFFGKDVVFLLCRVKQVKLAAHDRPTAASHMLCINLTHKPGPLTTPFARCSVALQMKGRHIFPHISTVASRKYCSRRNHCLSGITVHRGNTVLHSFSTATRFLLGLRNRVCGARHQLAKLH